MPYSQEQWEIIKAKIARILATYPPHPGTDTIHVDSVDGDNSTGNGTEEYPYQTLTYAEAQAAARDTLIAWGTFVENITLNLVGLRLYGLGNGLTKIQGAANLTPILDIGADSIELAKCFIDGSARTGHGIRIIDSDYCQIHHNLIKDITGAYDGIDKSTGSAIVGANIHHNQIIDSAGGGIGLVNGSLSRFEDNFILRTGGTGIDLDASCGENIIARNICTGNLTGIALAGDDNTLYDNKLQGNSVTPYTDTGTGNVWIDLLKQMGDSRITIYDPGDGGLATLTGGAVAWTFPAAWTQVIASTGSKRLLAGIVGELDVATIYELEIGIGAAASEARIETFKFEAQAVNTSVNITCEPRLVDIGVRVAARCKTLAGGSDTISNLDLKWIRRS